MLESSLDRPHKIPYKPEPVGSLFKDHLFEAGRFCKTLGEGLAGKIKDFVMKDPKYSAASAFFFASYAGDIATTLWGVSKYGIDIEANPLVRAAYYAGGLEGIIYYGIITGVGGLWLVTKLIKYEIPEENRYLVPLGIALGPLIRIFSNITAITHTPY